MVLNFSIENSSSTQAMINLFKFVNTIISGPVSPDSKYIVDKLLNPQGSVTFHAVCHHCSSYIGDFNQIKSIHTYQVCHSNIDVSKACSSNYFVIIDPSQTISDLLHVHENYYSNIMSNMSNRNHNNMRDIYDGKLYREFVNSLPEEQKNNYATTNFNTDGAPKFKSSQFSIWPIYLMVNELPIQDRLNNIITCGLWINKVKPQISVFLHPFVDTMNLLSMDGITATICSVERSITVYVLICCVDSDARSPIQGIKRFNGRYGCSWCEHPGIWKFGNMRYPIMNEIPSPRELQSMLNYSFKLYLANQYLG